MMSRGAFLTAIEDNKVKVSGSLERTESSMSEGLDKSFLPLISSSIIQ